MSKDPAVLFYTSDFLTGTQFFTDEQCGQYIRLLCQQHQLGHIPEEHLLKILKTKDNPVWTKFIQDEKTLWFNERMDIEKEKRANYVESRRKIGILGGRPLKNNHKVNHKVTLMGNLTDNDNEDVNINVKVEGSAEGRPTEEYLQDPEGEQASKGETPAPTPVEPTGLPQTRTTLIAEIIADLNTVLNTQYRPTTRKNIELITARLNEGFTIADFKTVHRNMQNAWGLDDKMRQFLRPITLYSPKFESYLNQKQKEPLIPVKLRSNWD